MRIAINALSGGGGGQNAFSYVAVISSNTYNYNLQSAATSAGWDGVQPLLADVTINSGIYVGSTSTGTAAFVVTSTAPVGSQIVITNNGYIMGKGGAGGYGISNLQAAGQTGFAGGGALSVSAAITFNNTSGSILGGGGGGGGGGSKLVTVGKDCTLNDYGGGGGGGRGYDGGAGGTRANSGTAGSAGTSSAGGAGGSSAIANWTGGTGGGAGSTGGTGGGAGGNCSGGGSTGYTGGAGGYAVSGNSNITWNGTGTRTGAIT